MKDDNEGSDFDVGIVGEETPLGEKLSMFLADVTGDTPSVADSYSKPELVATICDVTFFTAEAHNLESLIRELGKEMSWGSLWVDIAGKDFPVTNSMRTVDADTVCLRFDLASDDSNIFKGKEINVHLMRKPGTELVSWLIALLKEAVGKNGRVLIV